MADATKCISCADCGWTPPDDPKAPTPEPWPWVLATWIRDDAIRCSPCLLLCLQEEGLILEATDTLAPVVEGTTKE